MIHEQIKPSSMLKNGHTTTAFPLRAAADTKEQTKPLIITGTNAAKVAATDIAKLSAMMRVRTCGADIPAA